MYYTNHTFGMLFQPGEGCAVAYQIMSYWYLAAPRDASAEVPKLPWPYPLKPTQPPPAARDDPEL